MFIKSNLLILVGLAISTFAIGITEFISVGILPLFAQSFNVSILTAGLTVSVYAITVTIGTPIITCIFSNYSKKKIILACLLVLIIGNIICALSTNFSMLLFGRAFCALAHGIFMAIGSIVATEILPENKKSTGIAIMFSGLTFSTIVGVPLGTLLGNYLGWRATILFLILIGMIALIYNIIFLPSNLSKASKVNFNNIINSFINKKVMLIFTMTALGYGATFAPFTYIFPILHNYGGFSNNVIVIILMLYGTCVLFGNILGGKLGTIKIPIAKLLFFIFLLNFIMLLIYGIVIISKIQFMILMLTLVMGLFAFVNVPLLQLYAIQQAGNNNSLVISAINISFFNLGITIGSYLGKLTGSYINIQYTSITGAIIVLISSFISLYLWKKEKHIRKSFKI